MWGSTSPTTWGGTPGAAPRSPGAGLAGHFARHVWRLRELAAGPRPPHRHVGRHARAPARRPSPFCRRDVIAYDWYYYPFRRQPRMELRNFAEIDLAVPLRARGIEYWGCPMGGAFRHEPLPICRRAAGQHRRLVAAAAGGRAPPGCSSPPGSRSGSLPRSPRRSTPRPPACGSTARRTPDRLLESGARRMWGRKGPAAARALRSADKYPFSGYDRWQVNDRWDTVLVPGIASWRAEARALAPASPPAPGGPPGRRIEPPVPLVPGRPGPLRPIGGSGGLEAAGEAAGRGRGARRGGTGRGRLRPEPRAGPGRRAGDVAADPGSRGPAAPTRPSSGPTSAGFRPGAVAAPVPERDPGRAGTAIAGRRRLAAARPRRDLRAGRAEGGGRATGGTTGPGEDLHGIFLIDFRARPRRPGRPDLPVPVGPDRLERAARADARASDRGPGLREGRTARALLTDGRRRFRAAQPHPGRAIFGRNAPARGYPDFDWERDRGAWRPVWTETSG